MNETSHMFMSGHTVVGCIKLYNKMTTDDHELEQLMDIFEQWNGKRVPKVGENFKIPILNKYYEEHK